MPLFGAHMSVAGGLHKAVDAAVALGLDTVQFFTHSPSQWTSPPLESDGIRLFQEKLSQSGLQFPMAHDSYLINLASPDEALYRKSLEAFVDEVERAEALGLQFLVMHPGTPTDGDAEAGTKRIVAALDEVHRRCPKYDVMVLLETTAGQGRSLGRRFEELAGILDRVKKPKRLGVCVDTCHIFAAGYPLASKQDYDATFADFNRCIGIDKIRAFHLNDSVKPLGSRVDRHAAIGQGCLGLEPFRRLLNDRRFRNHPMVLETPKEGAEGKDMDRVNLATLRGLLD